MLRDEERKGGGEQGAIEHVVPRDDFWSPSLFSSSPVRRRGHCSGRREGRRGPRRRPGHAHAHAAGGGGGRGEEEHRQGGTVPTVPGALRGGQPGVAAPPRHRLFHTTVSVCVCNGGRMRPRWEAAPSPDSPGGLPVASAGRDSTKPRFSDPLDEGYFIYSTPQLF